LAKRAYLVGAAGAVVVIAAAVGYAVLVYPEQRVRGEVDRALASLPAGWSGHYDGLAFSSAKRELVLRGLALSRGEQRVAAGELSLAGFAQGADRTSFTVENAVATGVTMHTGGEEDTAARIEATRIAGLDAALAQALAGAAPSFSAERVIVTDYRVKTGTGSGSAGRLVLDKVAKGGFAAAAVEDLAAKGGADKSFTAARLSLSGADVPAIAAILHFPGAGPAPPADRRIAFGTIEVEKADFVSGPQTGHVDALQIAGLAARPVDKEPPRPEAGFEILAGLAFEKVSQRGLTVSDQPGEHKVALRALDLAGYDGGKLARGRLEGLDVAVAAPQPVGVTIGALELRDFDASRWLALAVKSGREAAAQETAGNIEVPYFTLAGLAVTVGPQGAPVRLAEISSQSRYVEGWPRDSAAAIKGLEIPLAALKLAPDDPAAQGFQQLGIDKLALDLDIASRWRPEEKHFFLDRFNLTLPGLGALEIDAALGGLEASRLTAGDALGAAQAAVVEKAGLRYRDASLVGRVLSATAAASGGSADQLRSQIVQQASLMAEQMSEQQAAADALRAIAKFVADPKALTVTVTPPQPFGAGEVMSAQPEDLPELIGLHVVAE
jgi:hypothetical protein